MGLIAREIEGRGIPTVGLTSALSITRAVRQPRAVYLDFPLGHTAGRPDDEAMQRDVVSQALRFAASATGPEQVLELDYRWSASDDWKDSVMRLKGEVDGKIVEIDDRVERFDTPQYQSAEDEREAARNPECPSCVFLES